MKKHMPFIINGRVTDCSKKSESESEQKSIFFRENSLNLDVLTDHISDEITSYKNSLDLTINNIVNFLYTVGQRWKNEEYTRRRRSFSRRSTIKKTAYTIPRQTKVVLPRTSL
ncbi:TPA: hypothetical protein ACGFX1_002228 [Vibrio cholerae]|uniref:hypothetical protein n=1 Tax=Vibrio cholerae TaxID=666 RepID=UPI001F082DA0|nr:hypothetical protein [Vibrio cholerae]